MDAGVPFTISITALDATATTVTSFRDSVQLSETLNGFNISSVLGSNFFNGIATATVTLEAGDAISHVNRIQGTNSLVYFGQGTAASGISNNILVNPDAYDRIVQVFPGEILTPGIPPGKNSAGTLPQVANQPVVPVKVFATDQFYNPILVGIPSPLNISFFSNVGSDILPPTTQLVSNPLQFLASEFIFPTVGTRIIQAQPSVNVGNTSQSTITVNAGQVDHYLFTIQPANGSILTADVPFTIQITAYDSANNVKIDFNGTFSDAFEAELIGTPSLIDKKWIDTNPGTENPDNTITFVNGIGNLSNSMMITRKWPNVRLIFRDGAGIQVVSNIWNINEGSPKKILLTYKPSQSYTPGTYPGNNGLPAQITAGDIVTLEARLVDGRWNVTSGPTTDNTTITLSGQTNNHYIDIFGGLPDFPPTGELIASDSFQVRFRTAGNQYLNAGAGGASGNFTTPSDTIRVNPGTYAKMALVAPGETLRPGIPSLLQPDGKEGTPNIQQVGNPFVLSAYATDQYWNPIQSFTYPRIDFTVQDPSHTHIPLTPLTMGGSREDFNFTLQSLLLPQITVFDTADNLKQQTVSINTSAGVLDHFEMDTISSPQFAGAPFNITMRAEDEFGNTIPSPFTVTLTPTTGTGTMSPTTVNLVNGTFTGAVTMFASSPSVKINMSMAGQPQATRESNSFIVLPSPQGYKKLLLLLDGEFIAQGTILGKTGSPTPKTAGVISIARAIACDPFYNPVNVSGIVEFQSNRYTQFGSAQGNLVNINGYGEYATTMIPRAAATHTVTLRDVNLDGTVARSTSVVVANPGTYRKIQYLLPGEVADPGTFLPNGKTIAPPLDQQVSRPFNVQLRAVDDFWNLVSFNDGDLRLIADITSIFFTPPNNLGGPNPRKYSLGISTRQVIIGQQGITTLGVIDDQNLSKPGQSVQVNVVPGAVYAFYASSFATAGVPFSLTIRLEENGVPVVGYNESIFLSAALPSGNPASGAFNPDGSEREYVMNNGVVVINDLTYAYVERIRVKLRDNFARIAFSNDIEVAPSGLKYKITVPPTAIAGLPKTFNIKVELLEQNTNTLVKNYDHLVNVEILSAINPTAAGQYTVTSANLSQGIADFQQSYTKAESIVIRIAESSTAGVPGFVIPSGTSNNITVAADGYKKILLIMPGETHIPGVPSSSGKTGTPTTRQKGVPFIAQVRAVDQYWNIDNSFSGGKIQYLSSDIPPSINGSNPTNQNEPFVNGESAAFLKLFNAGNITVTARDSDNESIASQSVLLTVGGNYYQVVAPAQDFSGPPSVWTVNVTLIDFISGNPIITANQSIRLNAFLPDGTTAQGTLGVSNANLSNGTVGILNQSYTIAENIIIQVSDDEGNTGSSSVIQLIPRQVSYIFETPSDAEVNQPFTVIIRTLDKDTGTNAKNLNRTNTLEAYSSLTGLPGTGTFVPVVANIINGVATISATYTRAEPIFLRMVDNTSPFAQSPPSQPVFTSAGSINVKAGALALVDLSSFTIRSNETRTFTVNCTDVYGNPISNQTLNLSIISPELPGHIEMNGKINSLTINANSQGQLDITFDPSSTANGEYKLSIDDGDRTNGYNKIVNIHVQGFPQVPAPALALGEDRIPVNSTYFLNLPEVLLPTGAFRRTFYRIDGSAWFAYDETIGIKPQDAIRPGINAFFETRGWAIEYYSQICYDLACVNPIDERQINGSPNIASILTYQVEDKLNAYPSPFNPKSNGIDGFLTIQYPLGTASTVEIDIYDLFGQPVWHKDIQAGEEGGQAKSDNRVFWSGVNDDNIVVGNGGYIIRVKVGATGQIMKTKTLVVK
ncbi:MAG: hypothetical protein ACKVQC_08010 [Elusimicrobiota bacterium]